MLEGGNARATFVSDARAQRRCNQSTGCHGHVGNFGKRVESAEYQAVSDTCGRDGAGDRHTGMERETREPQRLGESSLVCHGPYHFFDVDTGVRHPTPKRKGEGALAPRPEGE